MLLLFKSIARFFKKSATLLIGLFILIFASSFIFTALNTTSQNLKHSYSTLVQEGNLHDFVINEKYDIKGSSPYQVSDPVAISATEIEITLTPDIPNWTDSYWTFYDNNKTNVSFDKWLKSTSVTYTWDLATNDKNSTAYQENIIPKVNDHIRELILQLDNLIKPSIQKNFLGKINRLPITYDFFNAIEIPNNRQNIFYKVIESSAYKSIDKLVIYEGNNFTSPIDFDIEYFAKFFDNTNLYSRKLLDLLIRVDWSKASVTSDLTSAKKFFTEVNPNANPWTMPNIPLFGAPTAHRPYRDAVNNTMKYLKSIINQNNGGSYNLKQFRINFTLQEGSGIGAIPVTGTIEDFSSYEAIVSPTFLSKHNKAVYPMNLWKQNLNDTQANFSDYVRSIDSKYKFYIDSTEYVILGSGITPDFMYPVLSFDRPVPNYDTEALVYTNDNGYARVFDAFRGNAKEEFIIGRFNPGVNQSFVLSEINKAASNIMSWSFGTKAAFLADDISNQFSPTALRLQFIPQVLSLFNLVAIFLTLFVLFLSILISILIIKRFIEINKNSLGILLANGYKKHQIIISLTLFIGIIIAIATSLGFFLGFALQVPILSILTNLWTIPTAISSFSALYFVYTVLVQIGIFAFVSSLFSYISLKGNTAELMKDDSKYKMSKTTMILKKPFSKSGVMATFRSAVAFQSIWRLLLLAFMSSLAVLSFSFVLTSNNKFIESANATYKTRNYAYSIELATPTEAGGQYYAVPYSLTGMSLLEGKYFNRDILNDTELADPKIINQKYLTTSDYQNVTLAQGMSDDVKKLINEWGNYHLISAFDDENGQKQKLLYLNNKVQNQLLLDHFVGALGLGANPWEIAARQMPSNQLNYSNSSFRGLLEEAILDTSSQFVWPISGGTSFSYRDMILTFTEVTTLSPTDSPNVFVDGSDSLNPYRKFKTDATVILTLNALNKKFVLQPRFLSFIVELLNNPLYSHTQYSIAYNKMAINENDNPYSYIKFLFSSGVKNPSTLDETIIGINDSDDSVDLIDVKGNRLNNKLFEPLNNGNIPVVINSFASKKYSLKQGSTFKINPSNLVDRFSEKKETFVSPTFEVVSIFASYQNSEFFISQEHANNILGLEVNKDINGKFDYVTSGFNGIFSKDSSFPQVTNAVSLYSPSGLYPGYDSFLHPDIKNLFNYSTNLTLAKSITGIEATNTEEFLKKLIDTYGSSSVYSLLNNVTDKDSTRAVFDNLSETVNAVQISVMVVIITITLIIVIIMSAMIVFDSIRLASFLKCLGLNDRSNAFSFLVIYVPVFLIGVAIAIPLTFLLNFIYSEFIFTYAGILLVMSATAFNIIVPILSLLFVFLLSYVIAWYKIKRTNLPQIIK